MAAPLVLSTVRPDFSSLLLQLELYLQAKGTWKDLVDSSAGMTLMEMVAAVGALNQFGIESAAREGYLETALRDSSIYAITRMLGVRIGRKTPASVTVTLNRLASGLSTALLIPKFTQFSIAGSNFFNRDPILFNAHVASTSVLLYEGTVKTKTLTSDVSTFREVYLQEPGFIVSDVDIQVAMIDPIPNIKEIWSSTDQGIWIASSTDKVYHDTTSGLGDTIIAFGDGTHGAIPPLGNNIEITYVTTSGTLGNNGLSGLDVKANAYTVTGLTTSVIAGGSDEKPSGYYTFLAPQIFKARTRAVTQSDYKAIVSSYPGVASAAILAQRDIAPHDLRWMNVVRVIILPETGQSFSASQWTDFLTWFELRKHAAIFVQTFDPIKIDVDVNVTLMLLKAAVPSQAVADATTAIQSLFVRKADTLGKRIATTDITSAAMVANVDYIDTDYVDVIPDDKMHYVNLRTLTVNSQFSGRDTV